MSEQEIKNAIREFLRALMDRDIQKSLSFFKEDGAWHSAQGAFKGTADLKRYLTWMTQATPDFKVTETGIGIIAQGNTGVIEHILSGTFQGRKWEIPAVCVYEFSDGKIQNVRTFSDRLSQAQQVATGFISRKAVNSIVKAMEKGLR
jgi:ketosteroid isomerase-like protein